MKKNAIFENCLANVSPEIKIEVQLNMDISNKISDILKARNMTQRNLAILLNKRESEISRWLTGTHGFTTKTLAKITAALGEEIIETKKERQNQYIIYPYNEYVSNTDVNSSSFSGKTVSYAQYNYLN